MEGKTEEKMTVRCKFRCDSKTMIQEGMAREIRLVPAAADSEENKEFFKWTPCGEFRFGTINAAAAAQFEPGKDYYIEITQA